MRAAETPCCPAAIRERTKQRRDAAGALPRRPSAALKVRQGRAGEHRQAVEVESSPATPRR
jgi:hypothetical protein